ncbi:MAG: hypothetical protein ACRDSZ_04280 [Pseudonocardiaceae bacterium]
MRATLHATDAATRPKAAEQLAGGHWVAANTLIHLLQTLVRSVVHDLRTAERRRSTALRQLAKRIGVNR